MTEYSIPPERWERLTDVTVSRMATWHARDLEDRGADFYESLRWWLLGQSATEFEIGLVAIYLAWFVISETDELDERRAEQFELIGEHLAQAEMSVTFKPETGNYHVAFSGGAKVH